MAAANITAVILAGGKGRRLQGRDKGLVDAAGKPLIHYVLQRIQAQVSQILISANRNQSDYVKLGYKVIEDEFESGQFAGPLAGVLTALNACDTEFLLTVPCDTPCLPQDLVEQLSTAITDDIDIVTVNDGERLQPIVMLLRTRLTDNLKSWLEEGNRAVHAWVSEVGYREVVITNPSAFKNLNTDEELESFAQNLCN
jgi:molybdopterin-guanine dinucleotide biosynthesis protein A